MNLFSWSRAKVPACVLAAAVILTGCASPHRQLDRTVHARLTNVEVRSIVVQDEVAMAEPESKQARHGALMGLILDSVAAKRRQAALKNVVGPFYAAIDDVDFRARLGAALERQFKDGNVLPGTTVTSTARLPADGEIVAGAAGHARLDIRTVYEISVNAMRFEITAQTALAEVGGSEPVYANRYYYQSAPVMGPSGAFALWAENNGEKYRDAVAEGTREIARMIALDLSGKADPQGGPTMPIDLRNGAGGAKPADGVVVEQRPGRVLLRAPAGWLFSLAR